MKALTAGGDRGGIAIEAAILVPVLLVFLLVVLAAGRVETAGGVVDAAARDAARSASLARTVDAAQRAGQAAADATLAQEGVTCRATRVQVTPHFDVPPGQTGLVTATVSCSVPLADLSVPGLPGSTIMTSTFTSVVDRYRAR